MSFLVALVAGAALGLLELTLRSRLELSPDLAAVALSLLLIAPRSRKTAARFVGLLAGASSCSLEPIGAWLLGGGVAALVLLALRDFVFPESLWTQALFGLAAALALVFGRVVAEWAGQSPPLPWRAHGWTTPLLTAAAVPILARVGGGFHRMARWSRDRVGAWRGSPEPDD
jgi:hypothetical protein